MEKIQRRCLNGFSTGQNQYFSARLKDGVNDLAVEGPGGTSSAVGIDGFPVMLSATGIKVDLVELKEALTLPDVADSPEKEDHGKSEVGLEETLGIVEVAGKGGSDGAVELSGKGDEDEENTQPGAIDTENGLEWNVIERATLAVPCLSETDMCLLQLLAHLRQKPFTDGCDLPNRWNPR